MLEIGPYKLANNVALAPMAGVTDLPFRSLCARFGAGLVVSEMISANPKLRDSQKTQWRSTHSDEIEPRSVQIAGNDPALMAEAAQYNVAMGAQIIDINMGCPAKKVCRKAAGSALLADPALVANILQAVTAAVEVPVTLKIRTGSNPTERNAVEIARIAQDAGIAALAVHGRTRACAFRGQAEYDTIAEVVAAIDIPVFANGDICTPQQAAQVARHTGAAGIMIGRAAQGQPWLCGQIAHHLATGELLGEPSPAEKLQVAGEHLAALHAFYGDFMGLRIARKHMAWYFEYLPDYRANRSAFNSLQSTGEQVAYINSLTHTFSNTFSKKELAA